MDRVDRTLLSAAFDVDLQRSGLPRPGCPISRVLREKWDSAPPAVPWKSGASAPRTTRKMDRASAPVVDGWSGVIIALSFRPEPERQRGAAEEPAVSYSSRWIMWSRHFCSLPLTSIFNCQDHCNWVPNLSSLLREVGILRRRKCRGRAALQRRVSPQHKRSGVDRRVQFASFANCTIARLTLRRPECRSNSWKMKFDAFFLPRRRRLPASPDDGASERHLPGGNTSATLAIRAKSHLADIRMSPSSASTPLTSSSIRFLKIQSSLPK
jgi:hypothetical protein